MYLFTPTTNVQAAHKAPAPAKIELGPGRRAPALERATEKDHGPRALRAGHGFFATRPAPTLSGRGAPPCVDRKKFGGGRKTAPSAKAQGKAARRERGGAPRGRWPRAAKRLPEDIIL